MLSTDRKIFEPTSEVHKRMLGYAEDFEELFIIILGVNMELKVEGKLKYLGLTRFRAIFWRPIDKFDLVTSQDPFETGLVAQRLAKLTGAQLKLQIHTDLFNPYFKKQSLLNRVRVLIARFLLPRADKIRVVSQRIADSLLPISYKLKATPEVRPIFVDVEKIKNAPIKTDLHKKYPQFEKIILMASRLTWEKNIGLAIEAMRDANMRMHANNTNRKILLLIVGSGPEEGSLKCKVESLKLVEQIKFEPWSNDLPSYYKTADLFLLTSYYEGYGMTLVEANVAGCKIVSTDVGVAREAKAVIAKLNSVDLSNKIIEALA